VIPFLFRERGGVRVNDLWINGIRYKAKKGHNT
jgi:hypothetical protein